jgi:chromosome segregation ATPase
MDNPLDDPLPVERTVSDEFIDEQFKHLSSDTRLKYHLKHALDGQKRANKCTEKIRKMKRKLEDENQTLKEDLKTNSKKLKKQEVTTKHLEKIQGKRRDDFEKIQGELRDEKTLNETLKYEKQHEVLKFEKIQGELRDEKTLNETLKYEKQQKVLKYDRLERELKYTTSKCERSARVIEYLERDKVTTRREISRLNGSLESITDGIPTCCVCLEYYKSTTHVLMYGSCKHTICHKCYINNESVRRECSTCRTKGQITVRVYF